MFYEGILLICVFIRLIVIIIIKFNLFFDYYFLIKSNSQTSSFHNVNTVW